jgi:predicted nuclease with TOPRIM domain
MVDTKLVALSLICVVLCVSVVGAVMVVNQKDQELQTKSEQISGLENENTGLEAQVANLQSEIAELNNEKAALENQVSALQANITTLQTEIVSLEREKSGLESQISSLQNDLSDKQTEIISLSSDKTALESQVVNLESEISLLNDEKTGLETQVSLLQTDITDLQAEIAILETEVIASYQDGYDEGYEQGGEDVVGEGWYINRDPTYAEVVAFVNVDQTDKNAYTEDYVCYDFTADFNANAFQMGYRCGFVYMEFAESAHAIACFNTTDRGLIYVEPQTDEIDVDVRVGHVYSNIGKIVVKVGIIW